LLAVERAAVQQPLLLVKVVVVPEVTELILRTQ
jgi:hypothetical protein